MDSSSKQTQREKDRRRRKREQKLKTPRKKWEIPLSLGSIFLILFFGWGIYNATIGTMNDYKLANYGERRNAFVYRKVIGRGCTYVHYVFEINGYTYTGCSTGARKAKLGDSLMIVYLPSNPTINESAYHIDNSLIFK